jgi:hypothetical protein
MWEAGPTAESPRVRLESLTYFLAEVIYRTGASRRVRLGWRLPSGECSLNCRGPGEEPAMDESQWLTCGDPTPMLRFLQERGISERKARILSCACCRRIWDLLTDPRSRSAVEVAERFAEDEATMRELWTAKRDAVSATGTAANAAYWAASAKASGPLVSAFDAAGEALALRASANARHDAAVLWDAAQAASQRFQASLIREVIGDPFRDYPLDSLWLAWEGGTVVQLARGIYHDRAFDRMPILGDALEEAGCTHEAVLGHCRSGDEHLRGCWVLDLILGKG